jgi:hypothetical protein
MLTSVSRACGEASAKRIPMTAQVFRQLFDLFDQQTPAIRLKNVFFGLSMSIFLPHSG